MGGQNPLLTEKKSPVAHQVQKIKKNVKCVLLTQSQSTGMVGPTEWKNQQEALLLPEQPEKKGSEKRNDEEGSRPNKPADLEDVLGESVGEWGWFQTWIGAILFFCQATMAPAVYAALFTDFAPKHYCADNSSEEEFNMTVWESLKTEERRCGEGCQEWTFDQSVFKSTASSDFNIFCDQAVLKALANTFRMSGLLVGSFFFGWLSDKFGRVVSITASGITLLISQLLNGFSNSYIMFAILNFFMAAGGVASHLVSFVLLFEWSCPKYRTKASVFAQVPFAIGFLYVVFLSWSLRSSSWRTLQWVIAAPNLLFLVFPLILPESPRWLVSKGRGMEALASIATAAKSNNRPAPAGNVVLKKVVEGEHQGIGSLVKHPRLIFRLFIMSLNWIVITLCYYGLSINSGNQDLFIGLGTMAFMELVAFLTTMFLMDTCGRQSILSICQMLGGISCICAGFTPTSYFWLRFTLALVGKAGASACFAIVFVYTAEMFPTPVRNSAVGICSTVARIGALSAPAIADLDSSYPPLPFLIMGGGAVLVGSLSCLLPETRGIVLPETLEEAAALQPGASQKAQGVSVSQTNADETEFFTDLTAAH